MQKNILGLRLKKVYKMSEQPSLLNWYMHIDQFDADFSRSEGVEIIAKITFWVSRNFAKHPWTLKKHSINLPKCPAELLSILSWVWVGHLQSLSGMHGTGLMLARRLFLLSQNINNPAKMKFKVETSNNDSFAHWLKTNPYASRMVSEDFTDGWN